MRQSLRPFLRLPLLLMALLLTLLNVLCCIVTLSLRGILAVSELLNRGCSYAISHLWRRINPHPRPHTITLMDRHDEPLSSVQNLKPKSQGESHE